MTSRRSLAQSIFIKQLLLVLLPMAAVAVLIYAVLSADLEQRARQSNAVLAKAIADQVGEFLQKPLLLLTSLDLQQTSFDHSQLDEKRRLMDELIDRTGVFDVIYLLSAERLVEAVGLPASRRAYREDLENISAGGRQFIRVAQATDEVQWSDTFLSLISSTTSLGLAYPMAGNELLVGHLNIANLSRYVANLADSRDTLALILDKRGHIIAHPDLEVANQQLNISNQALVRLAISGRDQTGALRLNGVSYLASTRTIADVGWVVVTAQPVALIRHDIANTLWVLAFGTLLAALLALVLSRWMAVLLARPIVQFSEATSKLKRGEFHLQFPDSDIKEVELLADNFEQMAAELRQQQHSLRTSERKYRDLVDQVPCVICRQLPGQHGQVSFIGNPIEKISGYAASQFLNPGGLVVAQLVHPEDRDRREALIGERLKQRQGWGVDYRLLHRDGSVRWVYEEGRGSFDDQGELRHCDLMLIDNTQRKLAERNLQEQAELLLTLLDTIPSPIYYQNCAGELQGCNSAFERFFTLDQGRLLGRPMSHLVTEFPELTPLTEGTQRLFVSAAADTAEMTLSIAGEPRHITLKRASFVNAEEQVSGLVGVIYDLTDRFKAEAQNKQLRRYYGNVIDAMPSALIGLSAARQIVQLNREARNRLRRAGISDSAGYAIVLQQFGLEQDWIEHAIKVQQVDVIRRQPRLGGRYLDDITIYPLDQSVGGGAVIRIDDVTEQSRMEEVVVQSEKMLSVGGLAAGMAHEINNPLAGILQNVQVLHNRIKPDLPANQRAAADCEVSLEAVRCYLDERRIPEMLAAIEDSGHRAARIVENMLSFARKSDSDFIATDLTELLEQTVELTLNDYDLKKNYDFRDVSITREYQPIPRVRCAPSKLQQVFFNLLKNSAQAMASNGHRGQPAQITLRVQYRAPMVRVEIEDNGPGIEHDQAKRVFEPFYTTKEVGVGTGLGLSVSYFIVTENHRGNMWVEPRSSGACFVVELPAEEGSHGTDTDR
ncbi:ATP-binding protein [Motiliproteus sediminis]|uniref:ATP-binding protein n=1 Tax=Motiliproteus sediminis TaxID=1468178 RepID=UPI001AEF5E32|nr:ATP-binding protein [Motiliproteus sediminis]